MAYQRHWNELKTILNMLKRSGISSVSPGTLIILMDQLEQNQRIHDQNKSQTPTSKIALTP